MGNELSVQAPHVDVTTIAIGIELSMQALHVDVATIAMGVELSAQARHMDVAALGDQAQILARPSASSKPAALLKLAPTWAGR